MLFIALQHGLAFKLFRSESLKTSPNPSPQNQSNTTSLVGA